MKFQIEPSRTALVLTTTQVDFLSPTGAAWDLFGPQATRLAVVSKLVALRDAAERAGITVFYSMMGFTKAENAAWQHRNALQSLMFDRQMCDWERGGRIIPELAPSTSAVVLSPRRGLSAFHSTDIEVQLRQRNIQVILLAGLAANLCVESHLRDGVEHGYNVIVAEDAVSTIDDVALNGAKAAYHLLATEVVTAAEIVSALKAI